MATNTKEDIHADLEELRGDLKKLREDFTRTTRDTATAAQTHARDSADAVTKYASECLHERPVSSLLLAAGIGCVIGALFRR